MARPYGAYERPVAAGPQRSDVVVAASTATSPPRPTSDKPYAQESFIKAILQARDIYKSAANDMAKGAARVERKRLICQALGSNSVTNWIGKISVLSSNNDGRGVIEIAIGPQIYVKTWNNAVSDYGDHTLIQPTSSLYSDVVKMAKGEPVKFSGEFFTDDKDCVREPSLSM